MNGVQRGDQCRLNFNQDLTQKIRRKIHLECSEFHVLILWLAPRISYFSYHNKYKVYNVAREIYEKKFNSMASIDRPGVKF